MKRLLFLLYFIGFMQAEDKQFVVVVAGYNNADWYRVNLASIASQQYPSNLWRVIYVDDCSTDGTAELVENFIVQNNLGDRVTFIKNDKRRGGLYNQYHAICSCDDDEIVVMLDGDDWFAHCNVLRVFNRIYQDSNVWITCGKYRTFPFGEIGPPGEFCPEVVEKNAYRQSEWALLHPRSFYSWLFKEIKKEDLMHGTVFFPEATDVVVMLPMLELAGGRHHFVSEPLYVYNQVNPINCFRVRLPIQQMYAELAYTKKPYEKLKEKP